MRNLSKEQFLEPVEWTAGKLAGWTTLFLLTAFGALMMAYAAFGEMPETTPDYVKYASKDKQKEMRMEAVRKKQEAQNLLMLMGGALTATFGLVLGYSIKNDGDARREREILLEHGRFGDALIYESKVHENEEEWDQSVEIDMEIRLDGAEPYRVRETFTVAREKLNQAAAGSFVGVLAAPPVEGVRRGAVKLILK